MYILVEFYMCLDSKKLYRELEKYNMNVTDMGDGKVLTYGEKQDWRAGCHYPLHL